MAAHDEAWGDLADDITLLKKAIPSNAGQRISQYMARTGEESLLKIFGEHPDQIAARKRQVAANAAAQAALEDKARHAMYLNATLAAQAYAMIVADLAPALKISPRMIERKVREHMERLSQYANMTRTKAFLEYARRQAEDYNVQAEQDYEMLMGVLRTDPGHRAAAIQTFVAKYPETWRKGQDMQHETPVHPTPRNAQDWQNWYAGADYGHDNQLFFTGVEGSDRAPVFLDWLHTRAVLEGLEQNPQTPPDGPAARHPDWQPGVYYPESIT